MDKFDKYFKNVAKNYKVGLANTYVDYSTDYSNHYLYSNGVSIVMCDLVRTDFKENIKLKSNIIEFFEDFIDKTNVESIMTYDYNYVKNNSVKDGKDTMFRLDDDYAMSITQLNKIKGMIGCNKINYIIKKDSYHPIIEIVGKGMQVGYLLPMRIY